MNCFMGFADHYFERYKALPPFLKERPKEDVGIIVIIPCLDDDFIFNTLDSLEKANTVQSQIEVIVHVNSGEQTSPEIIERNRLIFSELLRQTASGFYTNFSLLPIFTEGTVRKKAGVGFARKTAMDEAVRRFAIIQKPEGLIVSLDADALVANDYFVEIMKAMNLVKAHCFTFQFQHHFDPLVYDEWVIQACRLYEIYLRYFRLALKTFDFPFAIHTIGSCFAIRAEAYTKLGGMPPRQGGEDFYFLQKAIKMLPVYEVRKPIVFPSPRISNRVPFGTGPSVRLIVEKGRYDVYNFELFGLLKTFYKLLPAFQHEYVHKQVPPIIMDFIGVSRFDSIIAECRYYSSSSTTFVKRLLNHFDSFFIVKFLNSFNQRDDYPPKNVMAAGKMLLHHYDIRDIYDLYEQILMQDINT